jgi:hypothetical protein
MKSGPACQEVSGFCTTISRTTAAFTMQITDSNTLSSTKDFSLSIYLRGDINDNGRVNMTDAIQTMQVMCGMIPAASVHPGAAVTGDSAIGLPEAVYILQKAAGAR